MNKDTLIENDHIIFGYDSSRTVLDDIDPAFARGNVTANRSGSVCGKTTLTRLTSGAHATENHISQFISGNVDNATTRAAATIGALK